MDTIVIGSQGDVRVKAFQHALQRQGYPPATLVTYHQLITGEVHLSDVVNTNAWVRIESPSKDVHSNQALLYLGSDEVKQPLRVQLDPKKKGLILAPHQWYLGLCRFLKLVEEQLAISAPHHLLNATADIALMFDKSACHRYLQSKGVSVPPALPHITSFEVLESAMVEAGWRRVFVKLANGSSASGVVAYETNGTQYKAAAAIEMIERDGQIELYNTRQIQVYRDLATIRTLINTLCQHQVHVEAWIPKARMGEKAFDLRVVVIDGKATHVVARLSHHPMTNLHLLNERQEREAIINCIGEVNFQQAMRCCEEAMRHFPHSLYAGVDLLIGIGHQQKMVLEMNAFGDLLHNIYHNGLTTYETQIQWMAAHEYA